MSNNLEAKICVLGAQGIRGPLRQTSSLANKRKALGKLRW